MVNRHLSRNRRNTDIARQVRVTLAALLGVLAVGTAGYMFFGVSALDSLYATVFTVTTVGFREIDDFGTAEKLFTILLMLGGVGTVLYTLTLLVAAVVDGHIGTIMGGRRMQREIDALTGHVIVCGYGRVGKATANELSRAGQRVVVIDREQERLADCPFPYAIGDATTDDVLRRVGVERAHGLVATLESDADSLFVTLSARALSGELLIIARARTEDAESKFTRAGANRVVNPQRLGGDRIAAFALQPHVVDFLDVAMHDASMEFRLEDFEVAEGSPLAGLSIRATREMEGGGALLLAVRDPGGAFVTNPPPDRIIYPGDAVIAVGTADQLETLREATGS